MKDKRPCRLKLNIRKIILLVTSYSLLLALVGCEAFVRKFTRKSKKENLPQEQMVIVPEEYKPPVKSKEELYREYFLYWKSWHDELIESLTVGTNPKKQLDCANEALKNLERMRPLFSPARQSQLDVWLSRLKGLRDDIKSDAYGRDASRNRTSAERIYLNIMQRFSYTKVKDELA